MLYQITFALFLFILLFQSCPGQTKNNGSLPFKLVNSIDLQNVKGRIDHLDFDKKRNIIYVAALGNNTVEAVDIKNLKVIHTIKDLSEPQGICFVPANNTIFIANGGNGTVDVYDAISYKKITSVHIGDDADNIRYDSMKTIVYAGFGDGGIAVIDGSNFTKLGEIKLSAHPESFQLDEKKIYVNVPDTHQIDVINTFNKSIEVGWKIRDASSNYPMSIDKLNHRLFVGCRHPSKLLVLDTADGNLIYSLNIDDDADDIFYDENSKQIYISCGSGYIDVIKQTDANNYDVVSKILTRSGARTSLFIPGLNCLIVAAPYHAGMAAQLMIYKKN